MTKKKTTESKEAIQQDVDQRCADMNTAGGVARAMATNMADLVTGKISAKTGNAVSKRAGAILKTAKPQPRK